MEEAQVRPTPSVPLSLNGKKPDLVFPCGLQSNLESVIPANAGTQRIEVGYLGSGVRRDDALYCCGAPLARSASSRMRMDSAFQRFHSSRVSRAESAKRMTLRGFRTTPAGQKRPSSRSAAMVRFCRAEPPQAFPPNVRDRRNHPAWKTCGGIRFAGSALRGLQP